MKSNGIENLCINTIRTLSMDAIQKANSGHPGAPMGLAPAAFVLFTRILRHNPCNPDWPDRDRFVLSAGHASMLLYSILHLTGYDVTLEDIKNFRQWGSKTPGHPECGHTSGVETTTGPLGQGLANAVGMAMAERFLASRYNQPGFPVADHHTYVICGDGCMMEGVSSEAASLAGNLGLSKLICLYDDNHISIEGPTDITFTEDVGARFQSYGWQVLAVEDGNDIKAIEKALLEAKADAARPSLIRIRTHIAFGSPNKQDSSGAHGAPLGVEEVALTKKNLGWPEDQFFAVPPKVLEFCRQAADKGKAAEESWAAAMARYRKAHPELAREWERTSRNLLPEGWDKDLPAFTPENGKMATRSASGKALNAIAQRHPVLLGGSADLAPSNNTLIAGEKNFSKAFPGGRNIRFGVREHAMGGILNGMAVHKGVKAYGGTFLVFADYLRPAIRVAALMQAPVIYVFTHDSIAVGEDGPTHQPVEHLASLRAIPGLTVIRPADASETVEAWRLAVLAAGPVALILSRQNLPIIDRTQYAPARGVGWGAYILSEPDQPPDRVLIATGSEVHLALAAQAKLREQGRHARVVSMPSWELFEAATPEYREKVLPSALDKRLVIEAASPFGWERFAGSRGKIIGMPGFGASAPGDVLLEKFGFTVDRVAAEAMGL